MSLIGGQTPPGRRYPRVENYPRILKRGEIYREGSSVNMEAWYPSAAIEKGDPRRIASLIDASRAIDVLDARSSRFPSRLSILGSTTLL